MINDIGNAFLSPLVFEDCSSSFWLPPPPSWIKVNVDGSVYWSLNRSGVGGVLRDTNGIWVGGFSCVTSNCDVLHNELYAILHGLSFAWEKGYKEVICESDSLQAIKIVEASIDMHRHPCRRLLLEIQQLLARSWSVRFSHVYRSANRCADYLAKKGAISNSGLVFWEVPDSNLVKLLEIA